MSRSATKVVVFAVAISLFGAMSAWRSLRVAMLPALDEHALSGTTLEEQRVLWLAFDEVLKCDIVEPCLATQAGSGWSDPASIERVCGAGLTKLQALRPPAGMAPKIRKNVELLREYWLDDLGGTVKAATELASGHRGGVSPFRWQLDTCTKDSVPARLDQLLRVVPAGAVSATCEAIRLQRAER